MAAAGPHDLPEIPESGGGARAKARRKVRPPGTKNAPAFSSIRDGVRIGLALMILRDPGLRRKIAALAQALAHQPPRGDAAQDAHGAQAPRDAEDKA